MQTNTRKRGYVPKFLHSKDAKKRKFNTDKSQKGEKSQKFGEKKFTKYTGKSQQGEKSHKFGQKKFTKSKMGDRPKHKTKRSK